MTKKAKIKVIKKKDIKILKTEKKVETNFKKQAAREMVSNVSSWVNDFQKRKRIETKEAIEGLFPKSPQTGGA
jgi:hypothetical protein